MPYKTLLFLTFSGLLTGCGSDSKTEEVITEITPEPTPETYTGVFLDSAVSGLNYVTASQNGTTNTEGEFNFQANELITFSIGEIQLPAVVANLYLTPLELFDTTEINNPSVVNLLRLLQSLDTDGDATNGIEISDSVHQLAADMTLDFSASDFEQLTAELVSDNGALNQSLISSQMAIDHFQTTLSELAANSVTTCDKTHDKIGHNGFFNTLSHNVAGKATIIDDCTIEISQFSYDGGGPEVYMYAAIAHQYDNVAAFPLGQKMTGTIFENATFQIKLPRNKTLDDLTGLSVWCVDFSANFGQMEFTP
jgi:hypothetical protein